jgi:hypothetical protein
LMPMLESWILIRTRIRIRSRTPNPGKPWNMELALLAELNSFKKKFSFQLLFVKLIQFCNLDGIHLNRNSVTECVTLATYKSWLNGPNTVFQFFGIRTSSVNKSQVGSYFVLNSIKQVVGERRTLI